MNETNDLTVPAVSDVSISNELSSSIVNSDKAATIAIPQTSPATAAKVSTVESSKIDSSITSNPKSKRPTESAFKQQRLSAWQPILTAGTVLPVFFAIGIAFIPIGVGLWYFSEQAKDVVKQDYTDCTNTKGELCADVIMKNPAANCECNIRFTLREPILKNVYMYYGLTNFYQNHRRYVKSRDDNQLLGKLDLPLSSECYPFDYEDNANGTKIPIVPCGAIANSMFNDSLSLFSIKFNLDVPLLRTGIAWPSDKEIKFRNPIGNPLNVSFKGFAKPKSWTRHVWELDPENPDNNGLQNEDLIVWMRTATLPTFRKLYRRIDHSKYPFEDGLPAGDYNLRIKYNYETKSFYGTKRMILSRTTFLGGNNSFLGIAYIVTGSLCLVLGVVLLFIHLKWGKRTSEMLNITPMTSY